MAEQRRVVVAAAIVRDGRVLAARRTAPPRPPAGGSCRAAKSSRERPGAALVREIVEELGCRVAVVGWLSGDSPIGARHVLRAAHVRLVEGEPVPEEHDAVRWLAASELDDVDWLDPDRPFLDELREILGS